MTVLQIDETWLEICDLDSIPRLGSRVIRTSGGDIALFRTNDDRVFALDDACPHRGGPLSQGIVHGTSVACPLHNWVIDLESGQALGHDEGCTRAISAELRDGRVFLAFAARVGEKA